MIRAQGPEDHEVLRSLLLAAVRSDPGAWDEPVAVAEARRAEGWRRVLEARTAPGQGAILGAWWGVEPVGMVGLRRPRPVPAQEGEIWGLYVVPTRRGQGIGAALVNAVEAEARRLGLHRLTLDIARTNEAAVRLLMAAGFRGTGRDRERVRWAKEL